jgi:signal transduction histidine kinase
MSTRAPFDTVDPRLAQLRRLTEISRALTYTTSLEQVTRLTVERGAELLDAAAAVLMLADAEGLLHVRAAHGIDEDRVSRFRAPLGDEVIGRLQGLLGVPDDCFVAVPLVVGGAVTGLVAVATRQPSTADDETLLSALADQAAVALESARLGGEVRLEMEDRLRASEGATGAKDRALATLAHDIRTPIGAIQGYCENLETGVYGPVNDRQREMLGRVRMSGRHLLSLLDNVLEMARLAAGVVRVSAEPVPLAGVAREAVEMLIPAAEAKGQTLAPGALADVRVTADPARVRQVLVNLLGNAVKFTPAGRLRHGHRPCTPGPLGRDPRGGHAGPASRSPSRRRSLSRTTAARARPSSRAWGWAWRSRTPWCSRWAASWCWRARWGRGRPSWCGCRPPPPGPLPRLRGRRASEGENCRAGRADLVGARFIAPVSDAAPSRVSHTQRLVGAAPRGCPCFPRHHRLASSSLAAFARTTKPPPPGIIRGRGLRCGATLGDGAPTPPPPSPARAPCGAASGCGWELRCCTRGWSAARPRSCAPGPPRARCR